MVENIFYIITLYKRTCVGDHSDSCLMSVDLETNYCLEHKGVGGNSFSFRENDQ